MFRFNPEKGHLEETDYYRAGDYAEPLQILPVLPDTYTKNGQVSAILVDPTGEWVMESARIFEGLFPELRRYAPACF